MHPALLAALVGVIAFAAGLFAGGAVVYRISCNLDDLSVPSRAFSCASMALTILRLLRNGPTDSAIEYLEFRLNLELTQFVWSLREHPRALQNEQFRSLLGRIAEYRMAYPDLNAGADVPPESQTEEGETLQLWPSLNEALTFARQHGVINLARP